MDSSFAFHFSEQLAKDSSCLIYRGDFTDEVTDKLISLSECSFGNDRELRRIRNKVAYLTVESFQNAIRHRDKRKFQKNFSSCGEMFLLRNCGRCWTILTSNLIRSEMTEPLREKLCCINRAGRKELNDLYMDILRYGKLSDKGGAGLGLVEMARKSLQPFAYEFEKVNAHQSLFYFQITFTDAVRAETKETITHHDFSFSKKLLDDMRTHNAWMLYKGDFSQNAIMPVLQTIGKNKSFHFREREKGADKEVYLVLIELLQNISRHAKPHIGTHPGIMVVGVHDDHYYISVGNTVDISQIVPLEKHLRKITKLKMDGLYRLYSRSLQSGIAKESGRVGLIDVAKMCGNKIGYDFQKSGAGERFFSLTVKI